MVTVGLLFYYRRFVEKKLEQMMQYHTFFSNVFDVMQAEGELNGYNKELMNDYYMHTKNYQAYLNDFNELLDEYFNTTKAPDIKYKKWQNVIKKNLKQVNNVLFNFE